MERQELDRWRGSCLSPSHTSAQLINRRYQTNKLFLLPIDSNLLAPGEPRFVYPTCHPCLAAAVASALLPSPLLLLHLQGRTGYSCGLHAGLHATPRCCLPSPGMQLQPGLLLLLGTMGVPVLAAERGSLAAHPHGKPCCPGEQASSRDALVPASPFPFPAPPERAGVPVLVAQAQSQLPVGSQAPRPYPAGQQPASFTPCPGERPLLPTHQPLMPASSVGG